MPLLVSAGIRVISEVRDINRFVYDSPRYDRVGVTP